MSRDASPITSLLRIIAFLGTGLILLWHVISMPQLQPHQSAGFVVLVLAVLAVGLTLLIFLPDAMERLLKHTDLLVPLGLFITVSTTFITLAMLPTLATMLTTSGSVKILTFSFSLFASFAFIFLLSMVYVGWTTVLIFQVVILGQVKLIAALAIMGRRFWRVLAIEFFGWGVLLAVSMVMFATATVSMPFALILIGLVSLFWNLATAAVLPVALADTRSFWSALRHGLAVSRAGMSKWGPLIIVQMVLLGWITFINVSYTIYEKKHADTEYTATDIDKIKTTWGVKVFWTGGYADDCKWHGSLMEALEAEPVQLIDRLLTLMFAILAIAIKIKIVSGLYRPVLAYDASSSV